MIIHATKLMLKDLKRPQSTSNKTKTKNNIKGGSIQEDIEINEH